MKYIMIIVAVSLLGACSTMGNYKIRSESGDVVNTVPKWYMADIKESRACDTSMFTKKASRGLKGGRSLASAQNMQREQNK